jgi:hypothetical protein
MPIFNSVNDLDVRMVEQSTLWVKTMKIKHLFLSAAIALLPMPALAQYYEPIPASFECSQIQQHFCYYSSNGYNFIMAIPDGYSGRYILSLTRIGVDNNVVFMFDQWTNEISAWMNINDRGNVLYVKGDINLLSETVDETVDMLNQVR